MRTWHDTDCTWTRGNLATGEPARPCSCGFIKELDDMADLAGLVPTFEFHLSAEEFDAFEEMLDSPPQASPKLAELLSRPSVFDDEDDIIDGPCDECGKNTDKAWDYLCHNCREVEDADA